jgi:hypothetical protein
MAAASGIATVHGNLFDTVGRMERFSFLYLNPRYSSEIGSMGEQMHGIFVSRAQLPMA